jgi:NADH:ubiquinone oxidoreductase subunit 6 (subunit J)
MTVQGILFYVFAAIIVFAALRVVTARNPVHSALWLVLAFFTAAAHWLMLGAEFLAIVLVLVYVGAVMVLFLFVIMMLDVNFEHLRKGFRSYLPVGATVGVLVLIVMVLVVLGGYLKPVAAPVAVPATAENTKALGTAPLHRLRLSVRDRCGDPARRHHCGDRAHPSDAQADQAPGPERTGEGPRPRSLARVVDTVGKAGKLKEGTRAR